MSEDVNKHSADNEDAFEREAAEGFAMLGSEEEIKSLKAETDAAFAKQFAQQSKTNARNWVWAVAAVLVLGLGVSVFTVLQPKASKDVAIVQTPQITTEPVPAPPEALSSAIESDAATKEKSLETPTQTLGFSSLAKNADAPIEAEESFAMASASIAPAEAPAPTVYANARQEDSYTNEVDVTVKREEKNLALNEYKANKASSAASDVQVLSKKANAPPAPAKSIAASDREKSSMDAAAADSITMVLYPAGMKQLRKDAKALLKGITLMYPLDIQLVLQNDGTVQSAKVFSKAVMDSTVVEAAQKALIKLPAFIVQKPADSSNPATYSFSIP